MACWFHDCSSLLFTISSQIACFSSILRNFAIILRWVCVVSGNLRRMRHDIRSSRALCVLHPLASVFTWRNYTLLISSLFFSCHLRGLSHWNLRSFQRIFSNILKLISSSVFDLEACGLFYFIQNLVVYDSTIKYLHILQPVKEFTGLCNIIWKCWFFNFHSCLLFQYLN